MKLINPFQMNDWKINKLLCVVFSVQFAMWGSIGLDAIGIHVPIIRQMISSIYLLFIPGILILRLFKLHKLGSISTFLFSVGLSLSTLMWIGFLINLIFPVFGILNPISLGPLVLTISAFILFLCFLCYITDNGFSNPDFIDTTNIFCTPVLFLFLIPIISILGTYFVNSHHNNLLLILMIIIIALVTLIIGFGKLVSENLYPFVIWVFSISLIYHVTLISQYLVVNDVVTEYNLAKLVLDSSYWNWNSYNMFNSVLSTTILAPIFYHYYNIDLTWVFKIVYPLIYSFVSLGIYFIHSNIFKNKKVVFLSSFFFVTILPSIFQVPLISKQSTAELFLALLLMIVLNPDSNRANKIVLSIIFAISLIVSHYGTAFLFLLALIFVYLSNIFEKNVIPKKLGGSFLLNDIYSPSLKNGCSKKEVISFGFVLLFIVFTFSWQIYISKSSTFDSIVLLGNHLFHNFLDEFMDPQYSRGVYQLTKNESSLLHYVSKLFYIISQFFIVYGFLKTILESNNLTLNNKLNLSKIYIYLGAYFILLLIASIAISGFAVMDPRRLFHISLFILGPFCIIGGIFACNKFETIFCRIFLNIHNDNLKINLKQSIKILFVFFTIFFFFNTKLIYEVAHDHPSSISISQESVNKYGTIEDKAVLYRGLISSYDVFSSKWLSVNMKTNETIYRADYTQGYPDLVNYGGIDKNLINSFDYTTKKIDSGYIQLSYLNVVGKVGSIWYNPLQQLTVYDIISVNNILSDKNKLYDNGGSQVFSYDEKNSTLL